MVRSSPALVFSVLFHVVIILGLAILTIASVPREPELVLTATSVNADTAPAEMEMIELVETEDLELTEADLDTTLPEMSELTVSDLDLPAASDAVSDTAAGSSASSKPSPSTPARRKVSRGSARDAVQFAGTAATGNRFAYVVDNSSSMAKNGKMIATIDQVLRSVEQMKPEQEFFVVLYSDTAYPMFYPDSATNFVPATRENKLKLREWLKTIEINMGGALGAAMKIVFDLKPDAVFLLGDGTGYGQEERDMLTGLNPSRKFVINTIALGASRNGAENLMGIARANQGQFQVMEIHPTFIDMSKSIRFRKNPAGRSWSDRIGR